MRTWVHQPWQHQEGKNERVHIAATRVSFALPTPAAVPFVAFLRVSMILSGTTRKLNTG